MTSTQEMPKPLPLTLIVATTPSNGIGRGGALPWPMLRAEMAYFARITKRAPSPKHNAVIMGRKTWESIPSKFRPLGKRLNVVVTSRWREFDLGGGLQREGGLDSEGVQISAHSERLQAASGQATSSQSTSTPAQATAAQTAGSSAIAVRDLAQAVERLRERIETHELHRVFVIGGAEIYKASMEMNGSESNDARGTAVVDRILRTKILDEFECDVHFPVKLGEDKGWGKGEKRELDEWTGEEVPAGVQSEKDVRWEFEMWKRVDESG